MAEIDNRAQLADVGAGEGVEVGARDEDPRLGADQHEALQVAAGFESREVRVQLIHRRHIEDVGG